MQNHRGWKSVFLALNHFRFAFVCIIEFELNFSKNRRRATHTHIQYLVLADTRSPANISYDIAIATATTTAQLLGTQQTITKPCDTIHNPIKNNLTTIIKSKADPIFGTERYIPVALFTISTQYSTIQTIMGTGIWYRSDPLNRTIEH